MARNNLLYMSFRMNVNNPQHVKIAQVINNLDKKLYKSKNQFVIDACAYYIEHYGSEAFMDVSQNEENPYIKREEFNDICEKMKLEAAISARDEVIRLLGSIVMNAKGNSYINNDEIEVAVNGNSNKNNSEQDDTLVDLVASWDDL